MLTSSDCAMTSNHCACLAPVSRLLSPWTRGYRYVMGLLAGVLSLPAIAIEDERSRDPIRGGVREVRFNSALLAGPSGRLVDVARFARGNPVHPGEYVVDVGLNGAPLGRHVVRFIERSGSVTACPAASLMRHLNIDKDALTAQGAAELARAAAGECIDPGRIDPRVSWSFDVGDLQFDLTVPQALLAQTPRDHIGPEYWEDSATSATLDYTFNTWHTRGGWRNTSTYLGIDSGLNLGNWHVRQRSALNWDPAAPKGFAYQNIATFVQRDVAALRSQLTLGDSFTDGAVFDSFGVRGVQLASDDRMLPDSMRGYAPRIRGVARSNARVSITQNGNRLYETTVAPGPFDIRDLYATGYGGDLEVAVSEVDGSEQRFTVPYASVSQLVRPAITRYSLAIGQLRDTRLTGRYQLMQGTVQHGFGSLLTGYAGATVADNYAAGLLGAAFNTSYGALAMDVTQASADIAGVDKTSGQSVRVSYAKSVPRTHTNLTVAAYRYSSSGFWAMPDAYLANERMAAGSDVRTVARQRTQLQLTLNQSLPGRWGNLYISGSSRNYWNDSGTTTQFQIGYNNALRLFNTSMMVNVSASRLRQGASGALVNQFHAGVSMPLGRTQRAPLMSMGLTSNEATGASQQFVLGGSALEDNALTYGLNASHARGAFNGGGNTQYMSPFATVSASASGGGGNSQYSAGLHGALVAHRGGVTLANFLGDTIGIVEAKGAAGARLVNAPGVRVNDAGYAVVPYLNPYARNTVELDPRGLPMNVELKSTTAEITPRANGVVMIPFEATAGRSAMLMASLLDRTPLPFGAVVRDAFDSEVGLVGQGGRIFLRGVANTGDLTVAWGAGNAQQCTLSYKLPPGQHDAVPFARVKAVCHASQSRTPLGG